MANESKVLFNLEDDYDTAIDIPRHSLVIRELGRVLLDRLFAVT